MVFKCDICEKEYSRRDNMLRHKYVNHGDADENQFENDADISEEEEEMEEEEDEIDPMERLVTEIFNQYQSEYQENVLALMNRENISEEEARERTYNTMKSAYRKALASVFAEHMLWIQSLKDNPVYQSIKKTVDRLIHDEDFDHLEAWKYACNKRKFLFEAVLDDYDPPEITNQ